MNAQQLKLLRDKSRELYLQRKRQLQQTAGATPFGSSPYYQGGTGPSGHDAGGMPTSARPQFADEFTVKYGVDPSPADVARYVEATGGDPYAAKLQKEMSRAKTDQGREALRKKLQESAGTQASSQQSIVDQMLGDVKAKIDEANAANDFRYNEVKGNNEALYGRVMGEVDNWGGVQSKLNDERAKESLSEQKAYLASRGLSNSNVLPAFQARNDRDLALTQQDLSERKSARRIGYDTELTNNSNAFIERRNDIAPDMAPYYNIALQYAQSGAGQQQAGTGGGGGSGGASRRPQRGGRQPSPVGALLSARRAAQMQASVGGMFNGVASGPSYYSGPAYTSNRYPTRRSPEEYAAVAAQRTQRGQQLMPTFQQPVSPLQIPGGPPQGMGPYYA